MHTADTGPLFWARLEDDLAGRAASGFSGAGGTRRRRPRRPAFRQAQELRYSHDKTRAPWRAKSTVYSHHLGPLEAHEAAARRRRRGPAYIHKSACRFKSLPIMYVGIVWKSVILRKCAERKGDLREPKAHSHALCSVSPTELAVPSPHHRLPRTGRREVD